MGNIVQGGVLPVEYLVILPGETKCPLNQKTGLRNQPKGLNKLYNLGVEPEGLPVLFLADIIVLKVVLKVGEVRGDVIGHHITINIPTRNIKGLQRSEADLLEDDVGIERGKVPAFLPLLQSIDHFLFLALPEKIVLKHHILGLGDYYFWLLYYQGDKPRE